MRYRVFTESVRKATIIALTALGLAWCGSAMAHEDDNEGEGHLIQHNIGGIHVDGGLTWFLQSTDGLPDDNAALTYSFDLGMEASVGEHGKAVVALEGGEG